MTVSVLHFLTKENLENNLFNYLILFNLIYFILFYLLNNFLQGNCVFDNYKPQKCPWTPLGGLTVPPPPPLPPVFTSLRSLHSGFFATLRRSSSFFINFCSHACIIDKCIKTFLNKIFVHKRTLINSSFFRQVLVELKI